MDNAAALERALARFYGLALTSVWLVIAGLGVSILIGV